MSKNEKNKFLLLQNLPLVQSLIFLVYGTVIENLKRSFGACIVYSATVVHLFGLQYNHQNTKLYFFMCTRTLSTKDPDTLRLYYSA